MNSSLPDIQEVYNFMHDRNIIISFLGDFDHKVVTSILSSVKKILDSTEMDFLTRKRLYSLIVENLENISRHSKDFVTTEGRPESVATIFTVSKNETDFTIVTGNFVTNERIPLISEKIEKVNALEKEDLQELYRQRLLESSDQGGGLGIIDISLKSGAKLSYHFRPVSDHTSFFIMQTTLSKQ